MLGMDAGSWWELIEEAEWFFALRAIDLVASIQSPELG